MFIPPKSTSKMEGSYGSDSGRDESGLLQRSLHPTHANLKPWDFPGWGKYINTEVKPEELRAIDAELKKREHPKLSEWPATAICGNDILSSCLYVSGLVTAKAGKLAPVSLALVAGILYLYRFIYGEVVNAIPMNGGSYNVLLNTTSKRVASIAASLAILSYIATGVVSGTSACTYLSSTFPALPVVPSSIGLLFFFAVLTSMGISESAIFALGIFILHTITLVTLCVMSMLYMSRDNFAILYDNLFETSFPDVNVAGTWVTGDVFTALFFGTSTAMLGISGFESSSQFVQEQAPGVFPKTLKNMWWGVAIFNPLISLLSLGVMPMANINMVKNTVLSQMALVVGGPTLQTIVSLDAFIVLSGAVLTAYVGINGLVRRLASDHILPAFLMQENSCRRTNHWILFGYFGVATSLVLVLEGNVETLSGVYTYAFLGLMTLFGSGCMLLKFKRADLKRDVIAPWWACILGVSLVIVAFFGNLCGDPTILTYFALYFSCVLLVVFLMFERLFFLRLAMYVLQRICPSTRKEETKPLATGARGGRTIVKAMRRITEACPTVFFCKQADLASINKAILYVRQNEQTSRLVIVHVYDAETGVPDLFGESIVMFDKIYPKLKIDLVAVESVFGPALIEWVATEYSIPKNMMFIKQPSAEATFNIASLGGVRIITG
ncbi:hypothetical protein SDRG_15944 [Saprolegnia diclina VS20]|uniref:Amino acid permease/ SLC12A domain-containing protein n=1 Tax=Saprolegnia diclina (strain VS20) TaxID=1156394 RepID=T0R2F2_SAPDV|nr:hypothetical protein SDRG_15944 [Saprolegnia diclina VS20]EQC26208.1 hypothetical protein SDRG_15944 [Saprolegnia diclina VS20]|eukprot:XP_008620353.1 hypothetical protein SDRG_15944 [Saprolegnia diclina VS20]